jgi:hypothetical protein
MSSMFTEDFSSDMDFSPDGESDFEFDEGDESLDDSMEYDDSESWQSRERARRAALRRRQLEALRRGRRAGVRRTTGPTNVSTAVRQTQAAVREVDLRNKVQTDSVASAIRAGNRRSAGAENALAASIVVTQLQNAFGNTKPFDNTVARVGLPLTPLLFLRRPRGGALWKNPQLVAPVLVAGIFAGKEVFGPGDVYDVRIVPQGTGTKAGNTVAFKVEALGWRGQVLRSVTPTVQTTGDINPSPAGGNTFVLGKAGNTATITATAGGVPTSYVINIE